MFGFGIGVSSGLQTDFLTVFSHMKKVREDSGFSFTKTLISLIWILSV